MENEENKLTKYVSETSKHREEILPFCTGYGVDIGFGGDAINSSAIRMDLPQPYANTGAAPVQLGGDCRSLKWLSDDCLDYVYSSHVLEDFDREETGPILKEWVRIVRPGGKIVLLLPDQKRYIASCIRRGEIWPDGTIGNPHHAIDDFSVDYVEGVARKLGNLETANVIPELGEYSFLLVLRKLQAESETNSKGEILQQKLDTCYLERDGLKAKIIETERKLKNALKETFMLKLARRIKRSLGK